MPLANLDEPAPGPPDGLEAPLPTPAEEPALLESIRALVHGEPFAVLCTQAGGRPYASLIAFAFSPDLSAFTFATPVATRKYRLLLECDQVALLVDNRARFPGDLMAVSAATVTGQAGPLAPGPEFERWAALLAARHPALEPFVHDPATALFRVRAARYLHVSRFQEVRRWIPPSAG